MHLRKTLASFATACLLLGLLTGYALAHDGAASYRAVLGVGFLGGDHIGAGQPAAAGAGCIAVIFILEQVTVGVAAIA